jgi:hypothetical protein
MMMVVVLRLLLLMAEREMHRLLQFLLSMQMHRLLSFFFMSVAAKLAGEEDGRRLRKNDDGVGNAGDGGGAGVAPVVDVVSKLREQKWWLVGKVVFFSMQRRKPFFLFSFFVALPFSKNAHPKSCRWFPPPP